MCQIRRRTANCPLLWRQQQNEIQEFPRMNLTLRSTSYTSFRSLLTSPCFHINIFFFQGTVEKQREQIRDLDSELSNIKADLEELKGQNDRLSTSNKVRKSLLTFVIIIKKYFCQNLISKSNTIGAPKKAATKPKPAPLPCRWKSRASGFPSV